MARSLRADILHLLGRGEGDASYRELLLTSGRSLMIRLLGVFSGFLVTWFTVRFFSAESLGVVSICIGILSLASIFAKAGHDVALMRYISGFSESSDFSSVRRIYRMSVTVVLPLSLSISAVLYLSASWMAEHIFFKPHLEHVFRWNALLLVPLTFLQVNAECLRGVKRIAAYTYFQTAAVSLTALFLLIALRSSGGVPDLPVYIQFVSIGLAFALSQWWWYRIVKGADAVADQVPSLQQLHRTASPMFTTTLMQLVMSWSGVLILAAFRDEASVGIFNALVRISVFTNITILAVNGLVMTRFAAAYHAGDLTSLRQQSGEAARLILYTSLPLFIGLFLFRDTVLSVFGEGFKGHGTTLCLLLLAQFIVVAVGLPGQLLNMTGRQRVLRNIALAAAVVNVLSGFLLIPEFGMDGACWSQLAGTAVWNLLCVFFAYKEFGFLTFAGMQRQA
jgi:O-antigen/teichoic acid export membrane protein